MFTMHWRNKGLHCRSIQKFKDFKVIISLQNTKLVVLNMNRIHHTLRMIAFEIHSQFSTDQVVDLR